MLNQLKLFNELACKSGNRYAAIKFVSNNVHKLSYKYNGQILYSQLISWVISGEKPMSVILYEKEIYNRDKIKSISMKYVLSVTDEYLCYIEDMAVCKSVRASMKASKEAHHLVYIYIDTESEPQNMRVRILTRMIWYSL